MHRLSSHPRAHTSSAPARDRSGNSWTTYALALLSLLVGLAAAKALLGRAVNPHDALRHLRSLGEWAPLGFIAVVALRPLTVVIPGQLLIVAGGMLFGAARGATYAMLGAALSTLLVYTLSRRFGHRLVRRLAGDRQRALMGAARRHGFAFVLIATANPVISTDAAIVAAASCGARLAPTLLGTLLGTLPGTILTAAFGSALGRSRPVLAATAGTLMVVSLLAGLVLGRRMLNEVQAEQDCGTRPMPDGPGQG